MSKMKELSMVLDELVTCGETLISTANALKEIFSESATPGEPAETKPAPKGSKKAAASPAEPKAEKESAPTPEPETYTKEQVRGILAKISSAGHSDEVRALLDKFGAKQLRQVDPKDYAALIKEAEKIEAEGTEVNADALLQAG